MASPIGHALAGYAAFRGFDRTAGSQQRSILLACAFLAISADLDFLPGILLGRPALYHQGMSHSFVVAMGVSLAAAGLFALQGFRFLLLWGQFFIAYASHLLLDLFGPDSREPLGIPLFWPISEQHFLSPVQVFLGFSHVSSTSGGRAEWINGVLQTQNLYAVARELLVLLPLVILITRLCRRRPQAGGAEVETRFSRLEEPASERGRPPRRERIH